MKIELDGYTTEFDVSLLKSFRSVLKAVPDEGRRVRVIGTLTVEHMDGGEASVLPTEVREGLQ